MTSAASTPAAGTASTPRRHSSASAAPAAAAKAASTAGTTSTAHSGALAIMAYLCRDGKLVQVGIEARDDEPGRRELGTVQQARQRGKQARRRTPGIIQRPAGRLRPGRAEGRAVVDRGGGIGQLSTPAAVAGRDVPRRAQRGPPHPRGLGPLPRE